jgi:hypothetical protein
VGQASSLPQLMGRQAGSLPHGTRAQRPLMLRARSLAALVLSSLLAGCLSIADRPTSPTTLVRFQVPEFPPPVGERYYLLVFSSQSTPKLPRYTHTWATVVRVRGRGPNRPLEIEPQTISWLPATLHVRTWNLRVEPGVNVDLPRTLEAMRAQGQRVALWGPYEIRADLYRHVLDQKAHLESGRLGYQALDALGEAGSKGNGINCIHAVTDADERFGRALFGWGESTTESIVKHLADHGALVQPDRIHVWLIAALGLENEAIIRRGPP